MKTLISIKYVGGEQRVFLNGTDVSDKLRQEEIGKLTKNGFSAVKIIEKSL